MTASKTAKRTIKTVETVRHPRASSACRRTVAATKPKPTVIKRGQAAIGGVFATGVLTMTGLSLSHLASGFALATHRPISEGWIMAGATDIGFLACEVLPFLVAGAVCSDLKHARLALFAAVVAASGYFNFLSMGPWGLAVPALMVMFAHFASRILLGRSH